MYIILNGDLVYARSSGLGIWFPRECTICYRMRFLTYQFTRNLKGFDDIAVHIDGVDGTDVGDNFDAKTFFQPLLCDCSSSYSS